MSSMYRIAQAAGQTRERRRQAAHPARVKRELVADGPSQAWSWDIAKLRGPAKGVWFHLYVLIDIYSRYNPGWIVAAAEESILRSGAMESPGRLILHVAAHEHISIHALQANGPAVPASGEVSDGEGLSGLATNDIDGALSQDGDYQDRLDPGGARPSQSEFIRRRSLLSESDESARHSSD